MSGHGDEEFFGVCSSFCCCCCTAKERDEEGDQVARSLNNVICANSFDRISLLAFMYTRYREKRDTYKYAASFYRTLDTCLFFIPLMVLQCSVSIVYAVGGGDEDFQRYFSGIASAVSALIIAIQNRMKYGEASKGFQNGARQYSLLASEAFTKWLASSSLTEQQFQAFVTDTGQLEKELQDTSPIPPAWITAKFEHHRLQMPSVNTINQQPQGTDNPAIMIHEEDVPDAQRVSADNAASARLRLMQAQREQILQANPTRPAVQGARL